MAYETKLRVGEGIQISGPCIIQVYDCKKVTVRVAPSIDGPVLITPLDIGDERLNRTKKNIDFAK